jgi:hypothetical protein
LGDRGLADRQGDDNRKASWISSYQPFKNRALAERAGSGDAVKQVGYPNIETTCQTHEHTHPRIALPPLDSADVGQRKAASVGYLLLCEAAFGADSEDVSAEAVERIAGHDRIVVA